MDDAPVLRKALPDIAEQDFLGVTASKPPQAPASSNGSSHGGISISNGSTAGAEGAKEPAAQATS